ncbi:MAG TPA: type II toxin-antitoxin system HicB family antitoxin [Afifellaceae bacterium]|nr:type II toxin-antitoxin system HicB family antitoxin [Afifellaceae bacterium]
MAIAPDLPGCMSDGETPEEALRNIQDAITEWMNEAQALARPVPQPSRRS